MNLDKEIIQINNITKDYGNNHGDFDINLKIHENEVVGIAGENGAGKTTLIRRRMGFIRPDGGNIKIIWSGCLQGIRESEKIYWLLPRRNQFPGCENRKYLPKKLWKEPWKDR